MPATYYDQFYELDPFAPPPGGTPITVQILSLTDQNLDGDLDAFDGDSIDGVDIIASYPGDTVTVRIQGQGNVTFTGITFYLADGRQVFTPTDGQVLEDGRLRSSTFVSEEGPLLVDDLGPPCLTAGTLVETTRGRIPVQELRVGDMILTMDNGAQPLLWLGKTEVSAEARHAPIRFEAGAMGNTEVLLVSPQNRMLVGDWQAQLFFGDDEVLVAAKHLVNGTTIRPAPKPRETYYHLLFERHEIIMAGGIWSESYLPDTGVARHERDLRATLKDRYPRLADALRSAPLARPQARRHEAALLAA